MNKLFTIFLLAFVANFVTAFAQSETPVVASIDTIAPASIDTIAPASIDTIAPAAVATVAGVDEAQPEKPKGFFAKLKDYLSNKEVENKAGKGITWNFIGGPYYSSDTKFGIAITGAAYYRTDTSDLTLQPSFTSAYATVSTAKFWTVGLEGTAFFKRDTQRLNYNASFGYSPRNYWGVGYEAGSLDDEYINLKQYNAQIHAEYIMSFVPNFYFGPELEFNYFKANNKDLPEEALLQNDRTIRNYGLGVVLQYDNRDLITNASRGVYAYFSAMFNPKFLWNKFAFTKINSSLRYYHTAWKYAIIAAQLQGEFTLGNPAWPNYAMMGGNSIMRGYYLGRYRDRHMWAAQVEIRQRIYGRNGIVVWGGVGNVFHDKNSFMKNLLPNYGIGYRFEFRKRMNIRLDLGFGKKGQMGVIFNMNEAF